MAANVLANAQVQPPTYCSNQNLIKRIKETIFLGKHGKSTKLQYTLRQMSVVFGQGDSVKDLKEKIVTNVNRDCSIYKYLTEKDFIDLFELPEVAVASPPNDIETANALNVYFSKPTADFNSLSQTLARTLDRTKINDTIVASQKLLKNPIYQNNTASYYTELINKIEFCFKTIIASINSSIVGQNNKLKYDENSKNKKLFSILIFYLYHLAALKNILS
jgi:hypothetical protein